MEKEYKVIVEDIKSKNRETYKVKIDEKSSSKSEATHISSYFLYCVGRILILVLIVGLCVLSYSVITLPKIDKPSITVENDIDNTKQSSEKITIRHSGTGNGDIKIESKVDENKRGDSIIESNLFTVIYLIILVGTIAALIAIFVTDDSFLKFAKLDELHAVREILLSKEMKSSDKTVDTKGESGKIEGTVSGNIKIGEKESQLKMDITGTSSSEKIISEKDNRADLLKHYMTCVTEL